MTPDYSKAKELAEKVLADNFVLTPPVNVVDIAKNYGLKVVELDLGDRYAHVAGFIDPKKKTVYVSNKDTANRKTFTVAHELGHWIMHQDKLKEDPQKYAILFRIPIGQMNVDPVESEANSFAACLLVPHKYLDQHRGESPEKIADIFKVSNEVIGYRLQDIYGNRDEGFSAE